MMTNHGVEQLGYEQRAQLDCIRFCCNLWWRILLAVLQEVIIFKKFIACFFFFLKESHNMTQFQIILWSTLFQKSWTRAIHNWVKKVIGGGEDRQGQF